MVVVDPDDAAQWTGKKSRWRGTNYKWGNWAIELAVRSLVIPLRALPPSLPSLSLSLCISALDAKPLLAAPVSISKEQMWW